MKSKILIIAIIILGISINTIAQDKTENKCFSNENFDKVKNYIDYYLQNYSSTGTDFYLEYPLINKASKEKTISKNPENVYNISFKENKKQIVLKSPVNEFIFEKDKGLISPEKEEIADDIFCYLLRLSDNSNQNQLIEIE